MIKRPNIVYICADQLAAKFLNCYGGTIDSTPILKELAETGCCFDRYYATHPVCGPNRATMLTGRSAEIHGITTNNLALSTDMPTYAHVLKANGYKTGGFGKFHQTPMNRPVPTDISWLGFDESVVSEDPKWGPYIDWVKEKHPDHYETTLAMTNGHSGDQRPDDDMDRAQGASEEQIRLKAIAYPEIMGERINNSDWERTYVSPLPAEAHDSTFITEKGLDFIKKAHEGDNKPFFCHISYVDPHDPYDPPESYANLFDPETMEEPLPAEWRDRNIEALENVFDKTYLNYRRISGNPLSIKKFRALFHGSLKFLDDQIGRITEYLKSSGLWENTVLVFSSDHGEMLGDHDMIGKGTPHYDRGIRSPLIVAGGPVQSKGKADQLCSTLDLYPTFCDWAGVPSEDLPPLEGMSLAGICSPGPNSKGSLKQLSARGEISVSIDTAESVISDDGWRLTRYTDSGEGQMFDLKNDPDEQIDLYDDPSFQSQKIDLLERLIKVRNHPKSVPNYRNIAPWKGVKEMRHGLGEIKSLQIYKTDESPWLLGNTENRNGKENRLLNTQHTDKPNLLLIHVDQQRYDSLGFTGHPLVKTPNLDRLRREGISFSNAFTPIPLCCPARQTLLAELCPKCTAACGIMIASRLLVLPTILSPGPNCSRMMDLT